MSYCRVCGTEDGVEFRESKRQSLCVSCNKETPRKVGRDAFDKRYWGAHLDEVPMSTRREFYSDYLTSDCSLEKYIETTTTRLE